jgi:hypothetical protein
MARQQALLAKKWIHAEPIYSANMGRANMAYFGEGLLCDPKKPKRASLP